MLESKNDKDIKTEKIIDKNTKNDKDIKTEKIIDKNTKNINIKNTKNVNIKNTKNVNIKNINDIIKKNNDIDVLDIKKINELLDIHIDYVLKIKNFIKYNKFKLRLPNFPEGISENIVREYISKVEKRECKKLQTGGDLEIYENKKSSKIEVKCFTSDGPLIKFLYKIFMRLGESNIIWSNRKMGSIVFFRW